jgi:hypothetical protein
MTGFITLFAGFSVYTILYIVAEIIHGFPQYLHGLVQFFPYIRVTELFSELFSPLRLLKGFMNLALGTGDTIMRPAILVLAGLTFLFAQTTAPPYRIHCGGESLHDQAGNLWEADSHYSGGAPYLTASDITGTDAMAIYQTERWNDPNAGNLKYTFDAPEGDYTVRLHFAEIYDGDFAAGARVFDVAINSAIVVADLDVFAEVGANTALIKEFSASSVSGKIAIEFFNKVHHAKVDGIEIIGTPKARATAAPYRIRAGSNDDFTDRDGNLWEADGHYTGGARYWSSVPVSSTTLPELYGNERWNDPNQTPLSYNFEVAEGSYLVKLHFAEIAFSEAGARVFDVNINGAAVISGLDLIQTAGQGVAVVKEFTVNSLNGAVKIDFINSVQNAKISAIEVLPASPVSNHLVKQSPLIFNTHSNGSMLSVQSPFQTPYTMVLRNLAGTQLVQKSGTGLSEQRFTGLRPGMYFIEVNSKQSSLSKKVLVLP